MKKRLPRKLKIVLYIALAVVMLLLAVIGIFLAKRAQVQVPEEVIQEARKVEIVASNNGMLLVNNVDGYVLPVREDAVLDASRMEIETVVRDSERTITVFAQPVKTAQEKLEYVMYSKRFLETNPVDHIKTVEKTESWKGYMLYTWEWHRPLLSCVPGDRNYYTCLDIVTENTVYTILIQTEKEIAEVGGYRDILDGFAFYKPREEADTFRLCDMENAPKQTTLTRSAETRAVYDKFFGDNGSFTWGIYNDMVPIRYRELVAIEKAMEGQFDLIMVYSVFQHSYDPSIFTEPIAPSAAEGRTYLMSMQTGNLADGSSQLYDILDGAYELFLTDFAESVANIGYPVMIRIGNEMNGDWCTYSAHQASMDAALYRAFYSYVLSFFEKAGADNVIWVWNPNERSYPNYKWNNALAFYPDEGADVYGITGYNNGTYYEGEIWRTFEEIYDPIYEDAEKRTDIPMMITEFGCAEMGGDKEAWIRDMFEKLTDYPLIRAAVWWNNDDWDYSVDPWRKSREYRINEDERYMNLFKHYIFGK